MRRTESILTIACVGLAASTAYLAYQLHAAHQELLAAHAASAPATPDVPREDRQPASIVPATPEPNNTNQVALSPDRRKNEDEVASRKAERARNADIPARPHDPDKLAQELRDIRSNYEKGFAGLRQHLDLTEDEYNRLLDILSEQEIRNRDAMAGCVPSAGCDIMSIAASQRQINRRQLAEFMGVEKAQRFRDYIDNFAEREAVANFRGRLPDALHLTDAQAAKLVEVLGDERRRMQKEWEQLGTKIAGVQGQYGSIFYPVTAQGVEQRLAATSEYLRRQRERAAEVLTAGQLEAFTQSQQDLLEEARGSLEAERRQAGGTQ